MLTDTRRTVRNGIADLYDCKDGPNGTTAILTPFIFPNGDLLELFVEETPDGFVVSDLGETWGWLFRTYGIDNFTPARRQKVREIENGTDVHFWRGVLRYECESSSQLAMGVHLVGQAALQMAELRHSIKASPPVRNQHRLDEWFAVQSLRVARRVTVLGRSQQKWKIDYETMLDGHISYAMWIEGRDHAAALPALYRTYATFSDIKLAANGVASVPRISILDDTEAAWGTAERSLLQDVSTVVCWSDQDQLLQLLQPPLHS